MRAERTRPEYGGVGAGVPNDPEIADVSRAALASSGPVRFDPESDHAVPVPLTDRFGVQSMIVMAVYPKVDKPYLFGGTIEVTSPTGQGTTLRVTLPLEAS